MRWREEWDGWKAIGHRLWRLVRPIPTHCPKCLQPGPISYYGACWSCLDGAVKRHIDSGATENVVHL